jgi:hypothetical protein
MCVYWRFIVVCVYKYITPQPRIGHHLYAFCKKNAFYFASIVERLQFILIALLWEASFCCYCWILLMLVVHVRKCFISSVCLCVSVSIYCMCIYHAWIIRDNKKSKLFICCFLISSSHTHFLLANYIPLTIWVIVFSISMMLWKIELINDVPSNIAIY